MLEFQGFLLWALWLVVLSAFYLGPSLKRAHWLKLMAIACGLVVFVAGCSTMGIAPAHSLDERLAYAYGAYTAVENSIADLAAAHAITRADGLKWYSQAAKARALLDAARAAERADPARASGLLSEALPILAALQAVMPANPGTARQTSPAQPGAP